VKCEATKNKLAGKYAFCRQKAEAKAVRKKEPPDYTKCSKKFSDKWVKVETRADGSCPDGIADPNSLAELVEAHTDHVALLLSGKCAGGAVVAGTCWFLGDPNQSCDDVCTAAGAVYDDATRTYAGSDGTLTHCAEVLDAVAAPIKPDLYLGGPDEVGCFVDTNNWWRDPTNTTASASWFSVQRACACK